MANTTPTFLRRFQVFARVSSGRKAVLLEPVQITLGFTGPVDPESGMVLNLAVVDDWIQQLIEAILKKTFLSRWVFCRWVRNKLEKIVDRNELNQVHFEFYNLIVECAEHDVFLKWQQPARMQSGNLKWISPVILTMKTKTSRWPPISLSLEHKIAQSLKSIRLGQQKWNWPGLVFTSLEYMDPNLGLRVRI